MARECCDCKKPLSDKRRKRCRKCYFKFFKGKNHPRYKHGKSLEKNYCKTCNTLLTDYRISKCKNCIKAEHKAEQHKNKKYCKICKSQLNNKAHLYNTRICKNCYIKSLEISQNNINWKGGISFEPYSINWTNRLKNLIRQRDNHTCQICGIEPEETLNVHHIDYDKKNCDHDNLVSLCASCHIKTNYNRKYWKKYFQEILYGSISF